MKAKPQSPLFILRSSFIAIGTACAVAIAQFTATARAPAQSVWGNALSFDGTNDWVEAGEVPLANSSFTIEAWARRDSSNTLDFIAGQGGSGTDTRLHFGFHQSAGNKFVLGFYNDDLFTTNSYTDNDWHHWAGTYNAATKARCIYCDGVLVASNTASANYQGSGHFLIGTIPWQTSVGAFHGSIDDVRIWSVALSQPQIAAQMTQPLSGKEPDLLAYWKFDESSGTNTLDATTNHFDGLLKSNPERVDSTVPWGYALSLNGTNQYVRVDGINLTNMPLTIELWAKRESSGTWDGFVGQGHGTAGQGLFFAVRDYDVGVFSFYAGGVYTTNTYTDADWHYWAATYNPVTGRCIYRDGALVAADANTNGYSGTGALYIGSLAWDQSGNAFDGEIDDVRIWSAARSQADVEADMNARLTGSESNLLAYWKFDEGSGTVAHDATTNHFDGTLVNEPACVVSTVTAPPPFTYTTNNGRITITNYTGPGWDVTIPDTINYLPVTSIGNSAFYNCTSLTFVAIPDSVTSIGDGAFDSCTSLAGVSIGNSVTNIGAGAFDYCTSLASVMIPDNVTSIGDGAFDTCYNLASVTIGNSVTNIGEGAFLSCWSLTGVTIPDGVMNIGAVAFADCESLTNINIPASVIHLGDIPFIDGLSLMAITVDTNNPAYTSVAGVLFNKDKTVLLEYPAGKAGSYTIPDTVTNIEDWAFYDCYNLTGVSIGNNVANIGDYAFFSCESLVSVTIPDNVTRIGDEAFEYCTSLTGVYFLGNAPNLGSDVFYGDNASIYCFSQTASLNPQVQTSGAYFGVRTNRFGFAIAGASGLGVEVQACTNLSNPTWSPVATLSFTSDLAYFGDSQWTNYPARFYRLTSPTFGGRPVVLWNARVQTGDASFGVRTNRFGFTITGTPDIPIVVEACTDPASGAWTPLQTCSVTNGSIYFCDPGWTNYPARFYHVRWP